MPVDPLTPEEEAVLRAQIGREVEVVGVPLRITVARLLATIDAFRDSGEPSVEPGLREAAEQAANTVDLVWGNLDRSKDPSTSDALYAVVIALRAALASVEPEPEDAK